MPARSASESCQKAAVSVSEMAKLCGLSRSHFYALVKAGVMPQPTYSTFNRRPFYPRELMNLCLQVKATNIGLDGRYVLFYAPRNVNAAPALSRRDRAVTSSRARRPIHADILDGLRALGMENVTDAQVDTALQACYPNGHAGVEEGAVLRAVWQHLRRASVA